MATFRYIATDKEGIRQTGELSATSADDASRQLELRGLLITELSELPAAPTSNTIHTASEGSSTSLSPSQRETADLASRMSELVSHNLPLAAGLRALAEEAPSRRMRHILSSLSARLEKGAALEQVFAQPTNSLPAHFHGLLEAGMRTGKLGFVLEHYLHFTQTAQEIRQRIRLSLCYPIILIVAAALLMTFIVVGIVPQFEDIFKAFDTELPAITEFTVLASRGLRNYGGLVLLVAMIVVGGLWVGVRVFLPSATRQRLVNVLPVVGPLVHLSGLARFCQLFSVLLESDVPLPEAIRLAGSGCRDANLDEGCRALAIEVENGHLLDKAAMELDQFPNVLVHGFRWHNRKDALIDTLKSSAEMFMARVRVQADLVGVIAEPAIIIVIAMAAGILVISMFMPLIRLLNDLS